MKEMPDMKSYSEQRDRSTFDWNLFLNKRHSDVNAQEVIDAYNLASSWITCAVGNQCAIIDRKSDGEPRDGRLADLGCRFYTILMSMRDARICEAPWMYEEQRLDAIRCLKNIEWRSQKLINEKLGVK